MQLTETFTEPSNFWEVRLLALIVLDFISVCLEVACYPWHYTPVPLASHMRIHVDGCAYFRTALAVIMGC